jgi:signal transduction histidine kinase
MIEDCRRLDHQMKSVLEFSRNTEYKLVPVNLHSMVQRLFERWRPHMARENVQPLLQIEPEIPAVLGDQRALEQVFTNLISNAVEAMSDTGGTLAIKATIHEKARERPQLHISVSDTGPGIPKENLDKIFRPFYTTNPEGTGLGLAITKRILVAHQGTIYVDSFPGGTVFYIQLPIANGHAELSQGGPE